MDVSESTVVVGSDGRRGRTRLARRAVRGGRRRSRRSTSGWGGRRGFGGTRRLRPTVARLDRSLER
jgi:hypothetical protein